MEKEGRVLQAKVALVVPNLQYSGGVSSVARFLQAALQDSGTFSVELISLATSATDAASVRILRPDTWLVGTQTTETMWEGKLVTHVGANWTELEFMRYQPRRKLTQLLNSFDLVQVVAGSPAWGKVACGVDRPVALQAATLASVERRRRRSVEGGASGAWRRLMTKQTSRIELDALSCSDLVFVENEWMFDFVSDQIGEDRVIFAPPGVDTSVFRPIENDGATSSPYILSVGRLADPRKNVPLLFSAYARFAGMVDSPPRLVLAGKSSPTQSDWNLAAALGIRQKIEFIRDASLGQLADLYMNASFFVSSSDEEGFGMAIVEAMASGIPVVCTRSGGPQTIIIDGFSGYLVDLGDDRRLSDAMVRLHQSPSLRKKIGAVARQTVETRYSMKAAGDRFIAKYNELLERKERA